MHKNPANSLASICWLCLSAASGSLSASISAWPIWRFPPFRGVEARSTYVASQTFEVNRTAQDALGWDVVATLDDGLLTLAIRDADGVPVQPKVLKAIFGRATHTGEDYTPDFVWNGTALAAMVPSRDGYWNLRLELESADGTIFRRRIQLCDR